MDEFGIRVVHRPWNKDKLVGQKAPFKLKEIWAIRVRPRSFAERGNWRSLILESIASCEPAIC
jgi:hypothetical protein